MREFIELVVCEEGVLVADGLIVIDDKSDVGLGGSLEVSEEHSFFDVKGGDDLKTIGGDVQEGSDAVDELVVFFGIEELTDGCLESHRDPNGVEELNLDVASSGTRDDKLNRVVLPVVVVVTALGDIEQGVGSTLVELDGLHG